MNNKLKKLSAFGGAALVGLVATEPALAAASLGTVAENVTGQFDELANLIGGASYVMGAAFGVRGALKLKEHNENPNAVKLSQPLTSLAVCGALFALPSVMNTGSGTIFGDGAQKTSASKLLN